MSGLDPTYKRLLQGEMSQSSSSNSLNVLQSSSRLTGARSRQASVTGSSENLIDDNKVGNILNIVELHVPAHQCKPTSTDTDR